VKIVFCVTNFGFLRNFQTTLNLLAQRGHRLHLVADRTDTTGGQRMVEELARTYRDVTFEVSAPTKGWRWYAFANAVRLTLDYWRYLDPQFADAVQLRGRAERQVPAISRWLVRIPVIGPGLVRKAGTLFLRQAERTIPVRADVKQLLERERPDLLLLTPLLYFGSRQVEHVREAQRLGIPSLLGVGSWDHLTTKGLIHEIPDMVAVWNFLQKQEAIELHHVPADRIVVTGAQAYDHWFDRAPGTTRDEFCARVGLPAGAPYVLYLCSSPFITPYEVGFVRRWIEALRGSRDATVRDAGILIRPHPQNAGQWDGVDLSAYGPVAIWPRGGANPIDAAAKSDYFDSMHHSRAVVGINTSGLIESGIVGRRVYSVATDEFAATQEGTLHFQHLKNVEGGLLVLSPTLDDHVAQLARALDGSGGDERIARGFVQAFVRPHGLDVAAAPRVVELIEETATRKPQPRPEPLGRRVGRFVFSPVATAMMLDTIDRDRWRSFAIQWTSRPRRALRGLWKWCAGAGRGLSRRLAGAGRLARAAMRRIVRMVSRASGLVRRRSQAVVYRMRRQGSRVD
jgi:hypothetical protein